MVLAAHPPAPLVWGGRRGRGACALWGCHCGGISTVRQEGVFSLHKDSPPSEKPGPLLSPSCTQVVTKPPKPDSWKPQ